MRHVTIVSASEAVSNVRAGATIAIQGSGGAVAEPTCLIKALEQLFLETGQPTDITLFHATGLGDRVDTGTDCLAHDGLVRRDIAGHLAMAPQMARMIYEEKVEGYNLPQGVISHLYSAIAARKPGVITKVGLRTFVDPRIEGGKVNRIARDDFVEVIELAGEEWLFYRSIPIDVAFVRGTTADEAGNISMEGEAAILEAISIAQAARACGGIVVAQVKHLTRRGSIDARDVKIPGIYVDYLVVDPEQRQHTLAEYDPSLSGEWPVPLHRLPVEPLGVRKVIGRRAARELTPGDVVNLGVGIPSYVASVAGESDLIDEITFTVEQGIVGGRPAGGVIFGVAHNPEAIIGEDDQFTFYDGGGLDVAFLGMAQTDSAGNVNVSKVGPMLAGCGGFINISQNAKRVVFCGTFTTKGAEIEVADGRLRITSEGTIRKFVEQVAQITFSGDYARESGQSVMYITERAVFRLSEDGVEITEIAPGIDLEKDIVAHMGFRPIIRDTSLMDAELFA